MAGPAGAAVRSQALEERSTYIDGIGRAIGRREAGSIMEGKEVGQVDVSDRRTAGENSQRDGPAKNCFASHFVGHKFLLGKLT